jgi:hypothetical protein
VPLAAARATARHAAILPPHRGRGDPLARSVTFGLENPLSSRHWAAVKTGTSKDMRDNWCIGFTLATR